MSVYSVEVKDEIVTDMLSEMIQTEVNRSLVAISSGAGAEIKDAVRELIYSRKDEIIGMVVDRAVKEIVKKGLPKLIERSDNG